MKPDILNPRRYDPQKHHRRSIRWVGHDYTQEGVYFVTVCIQGHACLFGEIVDGQMRVNDAGCMLQEVWNELPSHYPGVETDVFVLMPNHMHGIIVLSAILVGAGPRACPGKGQPQGVAPTAMTLGDVVGRFKTLTTKRYADGVRGRGWSAVCGSAITTNTLSATNDNWSTSAGTSRTIH
jgi:hypothetical protein